jgi:hypothetical protein
MPSEVAGAYGWVSALRADLEHEPTAADESILASIARLQLLELRLSRTIFGHGAVRRNGEVKPALTELRGVIRLKADLLRQLTFRDGTKPMATLEHYLATRVPQGEPIAPVDVSEVAAAPDRAPTTEESTEAGQ